MTPPQQTTSTPPGRAARSARGVQRKRGEGQWALGYREPLNPNERSKKDDNPLNVRARIESIYAQGGFDSIDPGDLRGRFRWWGLYTQRKPGIDGGRTAVLKPEELDDEYFMLRVRVDGGLLTTAQLRAIGEISQMYARDTADLTDRQNIQLHWVRIEDVPAIWAKLEAVGLSTTEACGDCPRVVLGSPVAGIAEDEIIDATPAIEEITRRFIGDPTLSNLPRKFKTAISGSPRQDVVHETNCVSFVGVEHPEHGPGFDLWVGGGLSTNPKLAVRLGTWVPLAEVPEVWHGVAQIFRDYGYRRLRHRARLKFLVADWGAERFREVLEQEYLGRRLLDGPAPQPPTTTRDHIGVHRQRDGAHYVGFAATAGRVSGSTLVAVAKAAERVGSGRVRTTVQQNLLVLDVPDAELDSLQSELAGLGLYSNPSPWRQGVMACTGLEFCKLAIVETKARAIALVEELDRRLADVQEGVVDPVTVNLNGCPNACARTQVADIGLKGQIVVDADGAQVEGFQVHLGGGLGLDSGFGRKLRGHKVTSAELPDYVERLVRRYLAGRTDGERFAQWVVRAEEAELR
ncbi:nitrite/sulfite reductase [Actinoalloteichus hymeniacidonis]|uniref:assimilatory sulfite reductase (ferredoxin) n=1 Tax=Actinoalloteichus hymeniacidonis TaxID=340345 RepID=A0AAC9N059_9PSEU|nr:nitrite/sulfite reductase [Actinoalloteichus hymeniacidonis]AOS65070.1 sulfite reductase, beta subunit (hemoprotein) [Actinoalloteichus hymeniacidonis]MBB5906851.1 sulfite reductase (ferredoxin) [Actinoalloteichus hymeniacidonis]